MLGGRIYDPYAALKERPVRAKKLKAVLTPLSLPLLERTSHP